LCEFIWYFEEKYKRKKDIKIEVDVEQFANDIKSYKGIGDGAEVLIFLIK